MVTKTRMRMPSSRMVLLNRTHEKAKCYITRRMKLKSEARRALARYGYAAPLRHAICPIPSCTPLRLVQLGAVLMALDANHRIGIGRMTGVQGAWELLRRRTPIRQNPAQDPQLEGNLSFRAGGSFQRTRHHNNLVPLLLFLSNPKMSLRFLTFTTVAAIYLVLGSIHEEQRLGAAYGRRYDRYRQGKPFYFPHP